MSAEVKVKVNGQTKTVPPGMTVKSLLEDLGEEEEVVSVQFNGRVLKKEEFSEVVVGEGDEVKILYFMGGGR